MGHTHPSLAQLAERLTVVVARHQHVAGSIPAARILFPDFMSACVASEKIC
jgi:hypothetical protein